jgi:hypothetical protein
LRFRSATIVTILLVCLAGCRRGPKIVPVSGKVLYKGNSLTSGVVMFQPDSGPLARGTIEPDGSFRLTTKTAGDGCTVGRCQIRVACTEPQSEDAWARAAEVEPPTAKSLIPRRYAHFGSSGLVEEVREGGGPIVLELTDERPTDAAQPQPK